MTPMVDLGFLLLTFFVLTTDPVKQVVMPIVVPEDVKEEDTSRTKVVCQKLLNLIVDEKHMVYYYRCPEEEGGELEFQAIPLEGKGLRSLIYEIRTKVDQKYGAGSDGKSQFVVVIKPTEKSVYKDLVDVLDEMSITAQKKFFLDKPTKDEMKLLDDYKKVMGGN